MQLSKATLVFLQNVEDLGRSKATITAYRNDLEQLASSLGDVDVKTINTRQLEGFNAELFARNFTAKTVSRKVNSVKSFFKFLLQKGEILVDPSKAVSHPNLQQGAPRVLNLEEIERLRSAAGNNVRLRTLIELMLQTGLRIGEVSRLKLEHLRLKDKKGQLFVEEFASSPMRIVDLNEAAANAIQSFLPHRLQVKTDQGYLFNTKNGGGMIIRNIRSSMDRPFKKANIKDATINDLRNTFIVHQLNHGVSPEKIGQTVGHKRFASTEKFLTLMERTKPGKSSKLAVI